METVMPEIRVAQTTGDVVLAMHPGTKIWNEFFDLLPPIGMPADFMAERPMNRLPQACGVFDDAEEQGKV